MQISYNWLKALLPDLTASPQEVADVFTRHSFETVIANTLEVPTGIQVVRIEKVEKHPNADRLQLATVTDGEKEVVVVCGAPNIATGQVVPYSPPGTVLADEEGKEFTVREAKIRGQVSPGMLNSLRELGLHASEHGGIWILPADIPLGSALADHFPVDTILDADITPDRAHDCLSHLGVARELAALLRLKPPVLDVADIQEKMGQVTVDIENVVDTARYIAAELTGAAVAPSPMWLQVRLLAAGGKPKNNVVDSTNYVMFEVGNPTHLFDAATLPSTSLGVRRAKAGEVVTALDEIEYTVTPDDLVVVSDDTPVAIAGVMGGMATSITSDTKDVVLEVATFQPYSIQETSRRLNLRSESSARFSKGIHPAIAGMAAQRIIYLLQEIAGVSVTSFVDTKPEAMNQDVISFRPQRVSQVAGIEIDADESADILRRLRCSVDDTNEVWEVAVPYDRLDLEGEHSLVEEVIRVYGLDAIPASTDSVPSAAPIPGELFLRDRLRDNLVALGLTETLNYSYEPKEYAEILKLDELPHLQLSNPPAPELAQLRVSLLPGMLSNLVVNRDVFQKQAGRKEASLFEIGSVYVPGSGGSVPGVVENLHLACAVVGGFPAYDDIVQTIADALGVEIEIVRQLDVTPSIPSDISISIKYRIPFQLFEFNLTGLMQHSEGAGQLVDSVSKETPSPTQFVMYSRYPSATRDISLLVDPAVSLDTVQEIIERVGGELVVDVDLFDELEWKDSGKKSLAFHVEYQADDRTLTDVEVTEIHERVTGALTEELKAEIR